MFVFSFFLQEKSVLFLVDEKDPLTQIAKLVIRMVGLAREIEVVEKNQTVRSFLEEHSLRIEKFAVFSGGKRLKLQDELKEGMKLTIIPVLRGGGMPRPNLKWRAFVNLVVDTCEMARGQYFDHFFLCLVMQNVRAYRTKYKMKIDCMLQNVDGGKLILLIYEGEIREIFVPSIIEFLEKSEESELDEMQVRRDFIYRKIWSALKNKPCRTIKESHVKVDPKLKDCFKIIHPFTVVRELKRWNLSENELLAFLNSIECMDFYCCTCAQKVFIKV